MDLKKFSTIFERTNFDIQHDKSEALRKEVAYSRHLITQWSEKTNPFNACIVNFP